MCNPPRISDWLTADGDEMSGSEQLRLAVVCSSNMNRSMEAHARLQKKGFNVLSFGTGDKARHTIIAAKLL